MGSLETGIPLKRPPTRTERIPSFSRPRSRFSRFMRFKKLDYIQWIWMVASFLFLLVGVPMFLPAFFIRESRGSMAVVSKDFDYLNEVRGLDFGQGFRFEPTKLLEKLQRDSRELNFSYFSSVNATQQRFPYRKPHLALVFADLSADPLQLLMVTVAVALRELGYTIQVYSLEDGPIHAVWKRIEVPVIILQTSPKTEIIVDWLNYDGILVNSVEAKAFFSSFVQEPFKSVPLIWTIHDKALGIHSRHYSSSGQIELLNDWRKAFARATVVVFPNYALPLLYSEFDAGNYYVIPGAPAEAWRSDITTEYKDELRSMMGYGPADFIITVVGSQLLYKGLWLEHAAILQALLPIFPSLSSDNDSKFHPKIIILGSNSASNYSTAVESIALSLSYPAGIVKHVAVSDDDNMVGIINMTDIVIYGSFLEEPSFPEILEKAMYLEKLIVAPDLSNIRKYVVDRLNGYLFPKENMKILTDIMLQVISVEGVSSLSRKIASEGRFTVRNLMASETIDGYALLLEKVLKLPSEVAPSKPVTDLNPSLRKEWQWNLFEAFSNSTNETRHVRSKAFLNKFEELWNQSTKQGSGSAVSMNDSFVYEIWDEERSLQAIYTKRRREEDELKDRGDQNHGTWEDVYRSAKKADRNKNDLHERYEGELLRTGQPLCIYEPFFGEGSWPFLHNSSLYRGIGLSTKGRRRGMDDVDAPSRLPLLNNPYYRDVLGEFGAFFAISNHIDRIHKNAWIGFQSWRATARKASLSKTGEAALVKAIERKKYGDALYFWVRMDLDPRNDMQLDFWSFCDTINSGNCKLAFTKSLRSMYGIKHDFDSVPPMPNDGTWSVMQSWALPTKSFLEFVMFSRMFVDALDAQMYDQHHQCSYCYLSLSKDKHCYSRLLELLVNVWAYHSSRRMVYINPETGDMQEQHSFQGRRGKMWIKWFSFATLKSMDEELAEEADSEQRSSRRWLWPSTGEVVWQGVVEKEKHMRIRQKERQKQKSKDKLTRMRSRYRQKALGKYVKPPPEEAEEVVKSTVVRMRMRMRMR